MRPRIPRSSPPSCRSAARAGRTKPPQIKGLPVWSFCGDADRDQTVLNMRTMIEALEREGAQARLTEYRGVGHNSWDRAYNDPELIDWMLAQRKPEIHRTGNCRVTMKDQPIMKPGEREPVIATDDCDDRPALCDSGLLPAVRRIRSQVPGPAATAPVEETRASNIRDDGRAVQAPRPSQPRKELRDLESKTGVATMIATVETLDERSIED